MTTFVVSNYGSGYYSINGNSNPTLNLVRGNTYTFQVNASGHPFWIKDDLVTGPSANVYSNGVTNNGTDSGNIIFAVPYNAPSFLFYVCQYHSSMQGILSISGNASYTETLTDSLTPSDSLSQSITLGTITDSVTPSDSISVGTTNATIADSSFPSDSLGIVVNRGGLGLARIKDKVSELVNSQLPEFIRSDYTTFVAFLKYYYKFLEQDQGALELVQNARKYNDIDETTQSFVNYFISNYAKDLPVSLQVNKSLLVKKIEGLYKAKGSSLSISSIFKILYDAVATTSHPYDFVLRPSDGRWATRKSIRVLLTSGSVSDIKDRFINITKNNIAYTAEVVRVKSLSTNLYEIFFKSLVDIPFEINDTVTVSSSAGIIFIGSVKPTTTTYAISYGGTGFREGEVFNVSVEGTDTLMKIARVGANGSIQLLKFINYGFNYNSNFTITLSNDLGVASSTKYFDTKAGGFTDSLNMVSIHDIADPSRYFFSDYVNPFNYTGNALASSSTTSQVLTSISTGGTSNPNDAIITFGIGTVAQYPGEYIATQGFLSEPDVKLQDKNLYQPFAYQIESELDISVFYDLIKKLVHQAGTNMFVNRIVSTTADVSANVSVETRKNVFAQLNSVFSYLDSKVYTLTKPLSDNTSISDNLSITFSTTKNDSATLSESLSKAINFGSFSDNVISGEIIGFNGQLELNDSFGTALIEDYTDGSYFANVYATTLIRTLDDSLSTAFVSFENPTDNASISENLTVAFSTVLNDSATPLDNNIISVQKVISDTLSVTDQLLFGEDKTLDDNASILETLTTTIQKPISNADSIVTLTESGQGLLLNYTDNVAPSGYFSEVYAGDPVLTIT